MVKKAKKIFKIKKNKSNEAVSINNVNHKIKKKKIKGIEKKINFLKRSFAFCKEIKSELKKVIWPSKRELFNGTLTVFIMVIIIATIVVIADYIFRYLLKLILGVM